MNFITTFKNLREEKRKLLSETSRKYQNGLQKLKDAKHKVEEYTSFLNQQNPIIKQKQIELQFILSQYQHELALKDKERAYLK